MICLLFLLSLTFGSDRAVEVAPGEVLQLVTTGQGQPVVLLPGLSGCAFGYRNVVPPLAQAGYQTIVIEPLAFGSSAKPAGSDYSLTAQAGRVAAVLDSLGVDDALLVGHGVAASIALRLAIIRPDLVRAIVSIEGGAEDSAATPTVEKSLQIAGLVAKLGGDRILRDRFQSDLEAASGDKSWVTGTNVRRYFAPVNRDLSASINALRAMARTKDSLSLEDNLHLVNCPVLLLTGEAPHEGGLSREELTRLGTGLLNFSHRSIPGAGHFIFEEEPMAVVQAIKDLGELLPERDQADRTTVGLAGNLNPSTPGGLPCAR